MSTNSTIVQQQQQHQHQQHQFVAPPLPPFGPVDVSSSSLSDDSAKTKISIDDLAGAAQPLTPKIQNKRRSISLFSTATTTTTNDDVVGRNPTCCGANRHTNHNSSTTTSTTTQQQHHHQQQPPPPPFPPQYSVVVAMTASSAQSATVTTTMFHKCNNEILYVNQNTDGKKNLHPANRYCCYENNVDSDGMTTTTPPTTKSPTVSSPISSSSNFSASSSSCHSFDCQSLQRSLKRVRLTTTNPLTTSDVERSPLLLLLSSLPAGVASAAATATATVASPPPTTTTSTKQMSSTSSISSPGRIRLERDIQHAINNDIWQPIPHYRRQNRQHQEQFDMNRNSNHTDCCNDIDDDDDDHNDNVWEVVLFDDWHSSSLQQQQQQQPPYHNNNNSNNNNNSSTSRSVRSNVFITVTYHGVCIDDPTTSEMILQIHIQNDDDNNNNNDCGSDIHTTNNHHHCTCNNNDCCNRTSSGHDRRHHHRTTASCWNREYHPNHSYPRTTTTTVIQVTIHIPRLYPHVPPSIHQIDQYCYKNNHSSHDTGIESVVSESTRNGSVDRRTTDIPPPPPPPPMSRILHDYHYYPSITAAAAAATNTKNQRATTTTTNSNKQSSHHSDRWIAGNYYKTSSSSSSFASRNRNNSISCESDCIDTNINDGGQDDTSRNMIYTGDAIDVMYRLKNYHSQQYQHQQQPIQEIYILSSPYQEDDEDDDDYNMTLNMSHNSCTSRRSNNQNRTTNVNYNNGIVCITKWTPIHRISDIIYWIIDAIIEPVVRVDGDTSNESTQPQQLDNIITSAVAMTNHNNNGDDDNYNISSQYDKNDTILERLQSQHCDPQHSITANRHFHDEDNIATGEACYKNKNDLDDANNYHFSTIGSGCTGGNNMEQMSISKTEYEVEDGTQIVPSYLNPNRFHVGYENSNSSNNNKPSYVSSSSTSLYMSPIECTLRQPQHQQQQRDIVGNVISSSIEEASSCSNRHHDYYYDIHNVSMSSSQLLSSTTITGCNVTTPNQNAHVDDDDDDMDISFH